MKIRRFHNGDEISLFSVFLSSVHTLASHYYTQEQIDAWAPTDIDPEQWANHMKELRPFVVEVDGEIAGYADLQPNGYIDHFFVSGTYPRQGVGTLLMNRIHEEARQRGIGELTSNVSKAAGGVLSTTRLSCCGTWVSCLSRSDITKCTDAKIFGEKIEDNWAKGPRSARADTRLSAVCHDREHARNEWIVLVCFAVLTGCDNRHCCCAARSKKPLKPKVLRHPECRIPSHLPLNLEQLIAGSPQPLSHHPPLHLRVVPALSMSTIPLAQPLLVVPTGCSNTATAQMLCPTRSNAPAVAAISRGIMIKV